MHKLRERYAASDFFFEALRREIEQVAFLGEVGVHHFVDDVLVLFL